MQEKVPILVVQFNREDSMQDDEEDAGMPDFDVADRLMSCIAPASKVKVAPATACDQKTNDMAIDFESRLLGILRGSTN